MKSYVLYVHDDRYSVPNMDSLTVNDDDRAKEVAAERLAASAHYRRAELWEGDRLVAKLEKANGTATTDVAEPPKDAGR